jgi:hypothetical protein
MAMPMQDLAETRVGHPRTGGHLFRNPVLASAEDRYAKRARIIKPQFPNGIVSSAIFGAQSGSTLRSATHC